ncbi:MAG TPA: LytTR family DNA-binding domain-containing protein [Thermoanaerobaculia bacterium]|jgi:two-component system LytT family response regulator|nr:LytTR family DNA-binding domain-containing protein [Thermoanaerobaculia bacterium]
MRAVIAEDEELARASLRQLVSEVDWVELVGEAADGHAAVETIDRLRPDLVFLDVMLPELTGLEVLQRVKHHPMIVFTTAYERFAVTAFELEALDYLVKPFGSRRFHETMSRVRRRFTQDAGGRAQGAGAGELPAGPLERLFARVGSRIVPIPVREVSHFQAEGDYVRAFSGAASHLLYVSLTQLEERLQLPFLRIHRSHMINVDYVQRVERHDERRYVVFLKDGSRIVASRSGTGALKKMMR